MANTAESSNSFTPNFGSFGVAIRIILLAELVAVIITIGRNSSFDQQAWQDLNLLSAFALILSFITVVILKIASPLIGKMTVINGATVVFLLLLFASFLGTEAMIFALYDLQMIPDRWPEWRQPLLVRSLIITAIIGVPGLRYLILTHRAQIDAKQQQESRMQALQSRIRPHFLFNSLNSIASLARTDPDKAEAILHDLADLFRVLLADARKLVPISAEREISRQYLEIEKIRLGDRLTVKWNVSNIPRSAQIPALTLQPMLENAIYHGIETRFGGGTVKIDMWTESDMLNIMISNPLADVPSKGHTKGNKIAQENTRQRLQTQFGSSATMQAFEEGGQYHVKLKMPIIRG
ncbi:MAG: histidine kinase [Gammaproteobacteria bacterium]|nr:MAG: histidine kinase [Gammaproteobacteria bacterium]